MRQRRPVALTAINEHALLFTQFRFQLLGHFLRLPVSSGDVCLQRQHLCQQVDAN